MWITALVLGLLGSFHCLGMCGPIAFMLPLDHRNPTKKLLQLSAYHVGRLLTYSVLGAAFGWIGHGLRIFGLQQQLSIIVGIGMISVVVFPSNWLGKWRPLKPVFGLISKIKDKLGSTLKQRNTDAFLTLGLLNGLLPCGLVYMALFASLAQDSVIGSLQFMFLFGLGTVPLMTTAVYAFGVLGSKTKAKAKRWVPLAIILVGALLIVRGMGLGIPYISPKIEPQSMVTAQIECHDPN